MKTGLSKQLETEIAAVQKVLIIGHRKPDGDALGSMCAMKEWIETLGKEVDLGCVDQPSSRYKFLPCMCAIKNEINPREYGLIIFVDCGAHYMSDFHKDHPEILAGNQTEDGLPKIVNIDHHASNDFFGHLNIVDIKAASTTAILYDIFRELSVEINSDMATCLLTGVYNDTGSFMHSNTSGEIFEMAGDLLAKGAAVSLITQSLFKTMSVKSLRSWGKALENASITDDNFVLSVVKESDLDGKSDSEQLGGVIDYLNMVPDVKFAMLVKEEGGRIKGSFRTKRDDVDLSKIASLYGGGGHPKASGFSIPGKLGEIAD